VTGDESNAKLIRLSSSLEEGIKGEESADLTL
jgi:hypothetical protein